MNIHQQRIFTKQQLKATGKEPTAASTGEENRQASAQVAYEERQKDLAASCKSFTTGTQALICSQRENAPVKPTSAKPESAELQHSVTLFQRLEADVVAGSIEYTKALSGMNDLIWESLPLPKADSDEKLERCE